MPSRVYLSFPSNGHKPPPTPRDRLNPHLCLQRRRFPVPRFAKRPDVALYAIGTLFPLPTLSSPNCTLKVSEHDSLWQPSAAQSDERTPNIKSFCAQGCLNALTPSYLRARLYEVIRWSGLLRCAPMMRSKTRGCTVQSVEYSASGGGSTYYIHTHSKPRLPRP